MKTLVLCCLAAASIALSAPPAHAAYMLTLTQAGSNVVLNGTGTLDLTALSYTNFVFVNSGCQASTAFLLSGYSTPPFTNGPYVEYFSGAITGPSSFGPNTQTFTTTGGIGGAIGINGSTHVLYVPYGYTSGGLIQNSGTFTNATIAGLGFSGGTYTYTWGNGANADSLTIVAGVPEPSTWALVGAGAVGAGVVALRRRRANV